MRADWETDKRRKKKEKKNVICGLKEKVEEVEICECKKDIGVGAKKMLLYSME